ncbi:MAG: alpha/beta hydrolase [Cellulophaga sp.]|nr:alpha/beta hydrolase [Cellulophaga sp.]
MNKIKKALLPLAYGSYFNALAVFSKESAAKKAFQLFSSPRKGAILDHQKSFLNEAKSGIVNTSHSQIQTYTWKGNKETVLLLHGWESNAYRWKNLIEFLKKEDFNIIAIDAPAHGNSSGKLLNVPLYTSCSEALIELYNPNYIIGHSMGGMTGLYHQYKNPENSIEKIVSLGSPSELSEIMQYYQNLLKFNDTVLESLDHYFNQTFGFRIEEFSISRFSDELTTKGLLVHDEFDTIAPFSAAERIHKNWQNSTLLKTQGLGHSLHQDDVNFEIINFLKSE